MLQRFLICILAGGLVAAMATTSEAQRKDSKSKKGEEKTYTHAEIEERTKAALDWLRDHQNPEGYWSASTFSADSVRKEAKKTHNLEWVDPGKADGDKGKEGSVDLACTSLALLAFVGNGYDHKEGDYRTTIRLGVKWLRMMQFQDGCFGDGKCSSVHHHAVTTMAICEIYGLSMDRVLKPMADKAVEYILKTQNEDGGWGAGKEVTESDTQMTGWCALALKTAAIVGLEFEREAAWKGIHKWLDSVSSESRRITRTGYKKAGDTSPRMPETQKWTAHPDMDAVNVVCRLFSGDEKWGLENKALKSQVDLIAKDPPKWEDKKVDLAYWHMGSLALFQFGGDAWKKWSPAATSALMDNQRGWRKEDKDSTPKTLDEHGSWDAVGAWHPAGGRLWSTAMAALSLETFARHKRLSGED